MIVMIWYLSIKILIDIDIISSFRLPGGFLARSPVVPKLRRSWHPSTWSSHTFPSRTDFWLNASGMPCAFSGWTPRKKRTDMAAIFGADWADLWSLNHEILHLPVRCACLPFLLFYFDLQSGPQALGRSWGAPVHWRKDVSPFHQGLRVWDWFHVWRSFTMFPACFW